MEDQDLYKKASKRVKEIKGFYTHLLVYILVNGGIFLFRGFSWHEAHIVYGWTPAFFWGIGLAIHGIVVFGKNMFLGPEWEERKTREIMEKMKRDT